MFALGGKLALIHRYGTDQPYADQWAAEGMFLLRGLLYYDLDFTQIIATHSEHRPGLSRLWVLGLIRANGGQWDCFVELVANLLIYGAFLALFWRRLISLIERQWLAVVAVFMSVLFALPCAYENFLWGFQSCFLFMLLAGSLHIIWTLESARPGWRWCIAQMVGLLGLFSIAAGAMSSVILVGVAGLEFLRGRRNSWVWATLGVNLLLLGLGLGLLPSALVPEGTRMARLGQAVMGSGFLLSWPYAKIWWCLFLQAPFVVMLIVAWRRREGEFAVADKTLAALGLWVFGMAFAIGYGRVVTAVNIGVRYYDVLLLGLFINFLSMVRLGTGLINGRRWLWGLAGLLWLCAVGIGLWGQNKPENLGNLFKFQQDQAIEQRDIIRDFLVTSDPARLQAFADATHRFPHMKYTLMLLRDPKVSALLPPSLTPDGHAGPLSRWAVRIADSWWLVLGAGVALLVLGTFRLRAASVKG